MVKRSRRTSRLHRPDLHDRSPTAEFFRTHARQVDGSASASSSVHVPLNAPQSQPYEQVPQSQSPRQAAQETQQRASRFTEHFHEDSAVPGPSYDGASDNVPSDSVPLNSGSPQYGSSSASSSHSGSSPTTQPLAYKAGIRFSELVSSGVVDDLPLSQILEIVREYIRPSCPHVGSSNGDPTEACIDLLRALCSSVVGKPFADISELPSRQVQERFEENNRQRFPHVDSSNDGASNAVAGPSPKEFSSQATRPVSDFIEPASSAAVERLRENLQQEGIDEGHIRYWDTVIRPEDSTGHYWWFEFRRSVRRNPLFQWPIYRPSRVDQLIRTFCHNLNVTELRSAGRAVDLGERQPILRLSSDGLSLEAVTTVREITQEEAYDILNISTTDTMAAITPSSLTWTLRFKCGKDTVILHADPLQTFESLKAELLHALQQRCPDGSFNDMQIPASLDDIILAVPVDPNNLSKTKWARLHVGSGLPDDTENGLDMDAGAGKKRTAKAKGKASAALNSPQGQGLKDGAVLAFTFRKGEDDGLDAEDLRFDVKLPTYDDVVEGGERDEERANGDNEG